MSAGFRRLGEELHYQGSLISLGTVTFAAPDGEQFQRDVVHHPGAVSVVPVFPGDGCPEVILVRQYRGAVDRELLEVVAGKRDVADEPPESTAHRELAEEVGLTARRLQLLAEFYNSPGFSDERSFAFLGLDLAPVPSEVHGIEEQFMTVERWALSEVPELIRRREIVDAKTIIALTLAREALDEGAAG